MSNYLGHLLERSFAPTQEVRPRIPSLFESPLGGPLPGRHETAMDATDSEITLPARPRSMPAPATTSDTARPMALELHEPGLDSRAPQSAPPGYLPPTVSDRPVPAASKTANEPLPAPMEIVSKNEFHFEPASPGGIFERTSAETGELSSKPVSPAPDDYPRALPPGLKPMIAQSGESGSAVPRLVHSTDRSSPPPSEKASEPRLPAMPPLSPASRNLSEKHERSGTIRPVASGPRHESARKPVQSVPAPAPSIHVTIGRIEVRAISPAAPARVQAKKEATMSLDLYLQKRRDGGRR